MANMLPASTAGNTSSLPTLQCRIMTHWFDVDVPWCYLPIRFRSQKLITSKYKTRVFKTRLAQLLKLSPYQDSLKLTPHPIRRRPCSTQDRLVVRPSRTPVTRSVCLFHMRCKSNHPNMDFGLLFAHFLKICFF